jgi:hypothetical protein
MLFKHKENGNIIELDNPSTFSLAERNGFEKVEKEEKEKPKK